jgi:hypothetical protein
VFVAAAASERKEWPDGAAAAGDETSPSGSEFLAPATVGEAEMSPEPRRSPKIADVCWRNRCWMVEE